MLREDVVKAVRTGQFKVFAVRTIDEGIAVLTGVPAGEAGPDGRYPEATVNFLVDRRLRQFAEQARAFRGDGSSEPTHQNAGEADKP
jgi:hypothetical protein